MPQIFRIAGYIEYMDNNLSSLAGIILQMAN